MSYLKQNYCRFVIDLDNLLSSIPLSYEIGYARDDINEMLERAKASNVMPEKFADIMEGYAVTLEEIESYLFEIENVIGAIDENFFTKLQLLCELYEKLTEDSEEESITD